jgi:hypothetical protein
MKRKLSKPTPKAKASPRKKKVSEDQDSTGA